MMMQRMTGNGGMVPINHGIVSLKATTQEHGPEVGDVSDYELVLGKKSDGTYTYTSGSTSGTFTINGNVLTFDKEITILTASNDYRKVELTGKEWTVLECESGDHLTIGIPASKMKRICKFISCSQFEFQGNSSARVVLQQ